MEDNDLLPEFLAEAQELMEKIYSRLPGLTAPEARAGALDEIFRNVHTIKGGSSMFHFANTQAVAHNLESLLSDLKTSGASLTPEQIGHIRDETQKIEALLKSKDQPPPTASPPHPMSQASSPVPAVQPPPMAAEEPKAAATPDYIRVPVQRINESMNGIAEIFLTRNQMVHLTERLKSGVVKPRDFFQSWDQLDGSLRRGIADLERSLMNMRMAPVGGLFARMDRVVQSYKADGKKILFKTKGETTELDKKVLDALAEPLVHLIRNAIDHGIEVSAERIKKNKSANGTVSLSAYISGNEAVIEVADDGKGMDPKAILASAKAKGVDTSHVTDDASAMELIFVPGFSTAATVSEISGRGVGMDAVKTSIQALGGKLHIQSAVGSGSTIVIRLPVSVSVSPAVIINLKGLKYAVPNDDIIEIRQTSTQKLRINAGKQYIQFRDAFVECIDLRNIVAPASRDHEENMSEASFLFFKRDQRTYSARVSSFESNTEIIVKPASSLLPRIPWLSGVSVLPTGEAIFVLSLPHVLDHSTEVKYAA
jgi:two-component system chemotaxis sensor kinase CheA